jgi:hypothetical protein
MHIKKLFTRKFLGELFPSRRDANFEKAHLKSYIKGHDKFPFGKQPNGEQIYHKVKQEIIQIN